jgi:hypothetical protein
VVVNKVGTIERCLARVREEFGQDGSELDVDQRRQDALVLNLLRACETAIDLAMHMVRVRALGAPRSSLGPAPEPERVARGPRRRRRRGAPRTC